MFKYLYIILFIRFRTFGGYYYNLKGMISMAQISVTPEQLKHFAKVYTQAANGINEQIRRVESTNGQMEQMWKGEAFRAYLDQYKELKQDVVKFEQLLESINNQLNKYADTVQQRDQDDSRSFGLR